MGKNYVLGILGAGNMGKAIANGAARAGLYPPDKVLLFNRSEEKRMANKTEGFAVTGDLCEVYTECETVLLAVKPQNFDEVLPRLAACALDNKPLIVSIAAGVPFARIENLLGADTPIIRVMPNTPMAIGSGAAQLVKNHAATEEQLSRIRALFDTMGVTTVFEDERMINEAIPYAGSAPAYIYAFADAMVRSAASHGINENDALQMFCQTMIGASRMLLNGNKKPSELIREVCSPGGTTLEGMKVLENRGFYAMIAEMCDNCTARAYELGK